MEQQIKILDSDPWNLLGKKIRSKHCKDESAEITTYDHTGFIEARCGCGCLYVHNEGVSERILNERENKSITNLINIIADD